MCGGEKTGIYCGCKSHEDKYYLCDEPISNLQVMHNNSALSYMDKIHFFTVFNGDVLVVKAEETRVPGM